MQNGTFIAVVGPSGVGKDALLAGSKIALRNDPRFVFVRRVVTREPDGEVEDHDTMSIETFDRNQATGRFALSWQAHGLRYALPLSVATDIALGRVVVANISRHVVAEAMETFKSFHLVLVTADSNLRAERLAARGRESREQISARLARDGAPLPNEIQPLVVDNSGSLANGVAAFTMALRMAVREDGDKAAAGA